MLTIDLCCNEAVATCIAGNIELDHQQPVIWPAM